jgi:hypothetical protein
MVDSSIVLLQLTLAQFYALQSTGAPWILRLRKIVFNEDGARGSRHQPIRRRKHLFLMIRKLQSGEYRLYSRKKDAKTGKRKNLGTFSSRAAAQKHERAVQYFKRAG